MNENILQIIAIVLICCLFMLTTAHVCMRRMIEYTETLLTSLPIVVTDVNLSEEEIDPMDIDLTEKWATPKTVG